MKIGYFITARLKSTRLKQKILLDLNGKTILDHVIERCKKVYGIDGIVLCTSTNKQDSVLYDFTLKHNIQFYPGSEDDVLQRLSDAAEYYGYDGFISITADNPFHSFTIAQHIVDVNQNDRPDFIFTKGVPIGVAPYFINSKALRVAIEMKNNSNTEIWGPFVNRPDFFNIVNLNITNSPFKEEKRLTCDYPEDYKFMQKLYKLLDLTHQPTINEVMACLENYSYIWDINSNMIQASPSEDVLKEIGEQFSKQIGLGLDFAKSIDKKLNPSSIIVEISL